MGRQRKKRSLKSKKSDTEEGAYESESILNTGVASTSIINPSMSKPESLKDNYKCQSESSSNVGESRTVLVPSRNQPSTSRTETSTDVFRAEPMDTSTTEKQHGPSTSEPRLHRTSLKVHISRCIRRRTWREPKEFRPSPEELLITYGVNAYQYWARNKNKDITKGSKRFKEDILALPLHQWNKILSSFIQTMSDPNGHTLSGGAILYIILGLQLYIFTHNRTDNLFFDDSFTVFSRALCELLASREKAIQYGRSLSLIEEDTLWLAGQLGAHSPAVLLTSIMYFNTKYFKLRTVKSHANLFFKNICLYYISMASGKISAALSYQPEEVIDLTDEEKMETDEPKEEPVIYDQFSIEDSIKCPVQLYKFYVSKCPKTSRGKDNKVYLTPIRDCSPDAEFWFSPDPLPEVKIFRMLQTFRYVKEIKEQF